MSPKHIPVATRSPTFNEVAMGVILAGTSGAAVLGHTFGPLPMRYTVPFVAIPAAIVLGCLILVARNQLVHFHLAAKLVELGGLAGAMATVAYDVIRPILKFVFAFNFNPFAAIPIFGQLMTGLSPASSWALTAGWIYHFWNGISFGIIYSLIRPKGGVWSGLVWGLGLAILMLITYPALLHVDSSNPGFLTSDFVGHAVWGLTLGYVVRKWSPV